MSPPVITSRRIGHLACAKVRAHPGENPLMHIILAFWALWHCRHARPPDMPLAD